VVVVRDGDRVCMASDSQTGNNGSKVTMQGPKIVRLPGDVLVGFTGSAEVRSALTQGAVALLEPIGTRDLDGWVADHLTRHLWNYFRDRGRMVKSQQGADEISCYLLVARGNEWLLVDGAATPHRLAIPWWAIGAGCCEARGAMYALRGDLQWGPLQWGPVSAENIAREAVAAACALDDSCGPPVHVEWTVPIPEPRKAPATVS